MNLVRNNTEDNTASRVQRNDTEDSSADEAQNPIESNILSSRQQELFLGDNRDNKRRVSISQDALQTENGKHKGNNDDKENRRTSISSYTSHLRKHSNSTYHSNKGEEDETNSWWYLACLKCRQKEVGPGWEPDFWPKLCPHPFYPSYRHVARIVALFIIGILIWSFLYCLLGDEISPGGQLFNIAVLCLTAHFVGWLFSFIMLPSLFGMIVVGIVFQNVGLIHISNNYRMLCFLLRKIALVVLLTRAGLDMDPYALKKLYGRIITLGVIPWAMESVTMALLTHYLLNLPWLWALLLGCIISAVSPAVVVPGLFRLRNKGYGVTKGIPTLVIAVAGIDDALSVAFFGLFHSIMFSHHSLTYNLLLGPISIIGGFGFGALWGLLAKYIPEKEDPFVVPLRVLMLFCGGLVAVFGSEKLEIEGAGPLGVISAAFVSIYHWCEQGWNVDDNPVAICFQIFWMICEPILFSLIGTQVTFSDLDPQILTYGFMFIAICSVVRIAVTVLVATGSSLNFKETFFCSVAWMSKASVQAVLAPVALESVRRSGRTDEFYKAEIILNICILAILITAPTGAIFIYTFGPRMLTKVKNTIPSHGWRRSTRPSLRDITVIDEEVENDQDTEKVEEEPKQHQDNNFHPYDNPAFTHI